LILSDNPIRDLSGDEFGFRGHAEVLCRAISTVDDLPLTLAVLGPWGSGKTSFLNICRSLLQKQGMTTVSFGPWKYDKRDEVWHAMLQTLLDELARQAENSPEPSIQERFKKVKVKLRRLSLTATWLLSRQLLTAFTPISLEDSDLDELKEAWTGDPADAPVAADYHAANRFEHDFAEVVGELTGGAPLAIFIDDLDRCRPATALSVLEALRIFTGDAPCLFVIALDQAALIDAAARHFDGDRVRGRRYLEKLVNFSYHLPGIRWESLGNALRSRLEFLPEDPVIWEVIRLGFQNNPRRVRRYVGTYNLTLAMLSASGAQSVERIRQVAILLMLRQEYPDFFARIQADPGEWHRLLTSGEHDPELVTLMKRISDRSQFDFPPSPSADLVAALSEVIVMTGVAVAEQR
jgi:KAP family P-loop domain